MLKSYTQSSGNAECEASLTQFVERTAKAPIPERSCAQIAECQNLSDAACQQDYRASILRRSCDIAEC